MIEAHDNARRLSQCSVQAVGRAHSCRVQASVWDTWEEGCGGGACEYCMCCRASGGPGNWGGGGGACMGHYASVRRQSQGLQIDASAVPSCDP